MKAEHFYHQAVFLSSASSIHNAPPDAGREVAFAGRSNAGKSTAINVLCGQKNLARTSRTPGRTQLINFFTLDDQRRLVDLPGYGFARVAESVRREWQHAMAEYLETRLSLSGIVLLMDVRHPLKEFDLNLLDWCESRGRPVHILLTKADKLKRGPAAAELQRVRRQLQARSMPVSVQLFSAQERRGLDQLWSQLDLWLQRDQAIEA